MKYKKFKKLLTELNATKVILLTGSYSDYTENSNSDLDFYVKPDRPESKTRNIDKVHKILKRYNVEIANDTIVGYISTIGCHNNLPLELEFSYYFDNKAKGNREVLGINFKLH